jgi:hypothetical protein
MRDLSNDHSIMPLPCRCQPKKFVFDLADRASLEIYSGSHSQKSWELEDA